MVVQLPSPPTPQPPPDLRPSATAAAEKQALVPLLNALRLCCVLFYRLNWVDVPEHFEENLETWMTQFKRYLS
jgi:exportin-2 (importin alpha re-exporter)